LLKSGQSDYKKILTNCSKNIPLKNHLSVTCFLIITQEISLFLLFQPPTTLSPVACIFNQHERHYTQRAHVPLKQSSSFWRHHLKPCATPWKWEFLHNIYWSWSSPLQNDYLFLCRNFSKISYPFLRQNSKYSFFIQWFFYFIDYGKKYWI
jgi:hypothetical protein